MYENVNSWCTSCEEDSDSREEICDVVFSTKNWLLNIIGSKMVGCAPPASVAVSRGVSAGKWGVTKGRGVYLGVSSCCCPLYAGIHSPPTVNRMTDRQV